MASGAAPGLQRRARWLAAVQSVAAPGAVLGRGLSLSSGMTVLQQKVLMPKTGIAAPALQTLAPPPPPPIISFERKG